jgi:hypothetical protein
MLEARTRPPDRAPVEALRRRLELARDAGDAFEVAWPTAIEATVAELRGRFERESWRVALDETRRAWEAAYAGAPGDAGVWLLLLEGAG